MDFTVSNHGSIVLLTPVSQAAMTWAYEHLPQTTPMSGNAIAVEHRCIVDIVAGIRDDGLEVGLHHSNKTLRLGGKTEYRSSKSSAMA